MYDELVKALRFIAKQQCRVEGEQTTICAIAANAIEELATNYDEATDIMKHQIEYIEELEAKLQDYMKAEVEGRMIILPVKEGTPLYVDGKIFAAHCKGEIHEVKGWYYSFPMIYKDFRGEHDYVIDPDSIGNSVFLTRKEAEENMAKEES